MIYGAGDAGELLLRELRNNRELQLAPIGFLDDDPAKSGKVIHGLRVFGGNGDLGSVCTQHEIDEVVISSMKMTEERVEEILRTCCRKTDQSEADADHDGGSDVCGPCLLLPERRKNAK